MQRFFPSQPSASSAAQPADEFHRNGNRTATAGDTVTPDPSGHPQSSAARPADNEGSPPMMRNSIATSASSSSASTAASSRSGNRTATAGDTVTPDPSGRFWQSAAAAHSSTQQTYLYDFEERTTAASRGIQEWSAYCALNGIQGVSDGMYPHRWHMREWILAGGDYWSLYSQSARLAD